VVDVGAVLVSETIDPSCTSFSFLFFIDSFFLDEKSCGRTHGVCDQWRSRVAKESNDTSSLIMLCFLCLLVLLCFGLVRPNNPVQSINPVQSYNPFQTYDPVINHSTTVQLLQTSIQPDGLPRYLEGTRQPIEDFSLRQLERQTLMRDTPSRNLIGSIEQQLSENNIYNIEIITTSSSSPPSYNDVVRQSSIAITMEQQSLLPPSYDDFIRANNEREEADL
jgi:hypothetical protein